MDIRQLDALLAIAEHKTFSKAARSLHTVQSNVSKHIARLEEELGAILVDRDAGTLTEEGEAVVARARRIRAETDAIALDMAAMRGKRWSPYVRIVPVRCLGSINAIWVADAMSKGVDGVMLLGCKYGDDYQCHFVKGSELCNRRMENIADSLNRLGVEPERVVQEQLAIDEYDRVPGLIDNFINYILKIGPNPFKGY